MTTVANMKLAVLHGWGHDRTLWWDFARRFPEGEVVLIDLPGFGAEPLVSGDWGVPEYAAWAAERLGALHRERGDSMVLLGHSFGGRIAALVAGERPPWLRGLVLYAAPCLYRPTPSARAKAAAAGFLKRLGARRIAGSRYDREDLRQAEAMGLGTVFRRVIAFDETDALRKIAVPTLLVWGARDTYPSPAMGREMQALISGSTLRIMEHEGHNAHLENPTLFYGIIRQFINGL